ncbi:DMT family transporter [Desulfotomaculum defluvii]
MKSFFGGAFYLSLAASIWGGMYVVSKYALDTIPPFTLVFIRYLIASFLLLGILCYKKEQLIPKEQRNLVFQIGFVGYFLSIIAQFIGTKLSSAHMGAVITTLSPVFLSAFAIPLLKERMTLKQGFSITIALIGVLVVVGIPGSHGQSETITGNMFLLAAAVFWGYYSVISRKISTVYSSLQITTWGILIATVLTFPCIFFERNLWSFGQLFDLPIVLSVLYIGIISTALAFFSWNKGLSMLPSHQAGLFFFFQPVVGTLLGWLFLKEQLSSTFFLGSLFIILGVYYNMKQEGGQTISKPKTSSSN